MGQRLQADRAQNRMTIMHSHGLDVTRLAADFSAAVRGRHTTHQLTQINVRNAAEHDPQIDHVFDFHDAHELMEQAVHRQMPHVDSWPDIAPAMTEAWGRAKSSQFALSRVLVACEFSGRVRDSFAALGHDALSCDLLPTDRPGPHYQGDVRDILNDGWDTMLAFPDCTYLTIAAEWCYRDVQTKAIAPGTLIGAERRHAREQALDFVRLLLDAKIRRKCLENPRGVIGTRIRPADQWIQPNEFGEDASKNTGLWLENLPKLQPTKYIKPRWVNGKPRWGNQTDGGYNRLGPSPDRWKLRATTYWGIAKAFANQWGRNATAMQQLQLI
jgi:hypothetical protein